MLTSVKFRSGSEFEIINRDKMALQKDIVYV